MPPSNDIDSTLQNIENDIDSCDEADGERIISSVALKEEVEQSTPRIVTAMVRATNAEVAASSDLGELSKAEMEVVHECQRLGDLLNDRIQSAMSEIFREACNNRFRQFKRMTERMVSTGINWGRIAIIFSLASKFISLFSKGLDLAQQITTYLIDFVKKRLFSWIVDSGGWQSIKEYTEDVYRNPTNKQIIGATTLGALTIIGFIYFKFIRK